jgi:hypothetical protein
MHNEYATKERTSPVQVVIGATGGLVRHCVAVLQRTAVI